MPRFVLIVEARHEHADLESLERVARFVGLKASFSRGDAVPPSLRGIEQCERYDATRLRLVDFGGGAKGAGHRLNGFSKSNAFRALRRLRAAYGQKIILQSSIAIFAFDGRPALLSLPGSFVSACAALEIRLSFIHYS